MASTASGKAGQAAGRRVRYGRGPGSMSGRAESGQDWTAGYAMPAAGRDRRQAGRPERPGRVRAAGVPAKTYHRIVLAEFVTCIVLIGASPVLTPRTKAGGPAAAVE
ncbi:MAG: hypothetical protein ACRDND_25710, partial [Streptosporangiaceae bacterium]